ncbi:MAG: MFS transporter [Candidatus Thorarchaeota archaeon]
MTEINNEIEKPDTNIRGYLIFLVGQWISIFGSNVVGFSIIWFLTVTTGSTFVLGLSTFLNFAPFIIATPIAGVFIDRWSRKKVIAFVDFMQAFFTVILIGFFVIDIFNPLELVAILLTLNTIRALFGAFHTSAVDTLLPIMVPKQHYSRINGINYLVNGIIGGIAGPIIGAFTLEVLLIPLKTILWLDVLTFLIAIIPTVLIYFPKVKRKISDKKEETSFRTEFKQGMNFIRDTPGLFALLFVFAGANLFMTPFYTQLPLFVTTTHFGGATQLAFLFTAQQAGMLIGSTVMSTWKGFENHSRGVAIGLFIGYLGFVIVVAAPLGYFEIIATGLFLAGFTLPIANVSSEAIWASIVPQGILGRVYAVRRTLAQITAPVAMLMSGIIAEFINLNLVLLTCTLFGLMVLGYSWFFTRLPEVEKLIEFKDTVETQPIVS